MACTTILVGKRHLMMAQPWLLEQKILKMEISRLKMIVVKPEDQPRHYRSVQSSFEMDLPDNPMTYVCSRCAW